uniref:Transcription regulator n=1 Tax=Solanum tuberosum TaxID=4113 RepID=M1B5N9_SOLTU
MLRRGKLMPAAAAGGSSINKKMIKKNRASSEKVGAWSKEDEITILKGLIKLKTEKGKNRFDYVQLYESIKQSVGHKSATALHLQKKVKSLREKYKNNLKNSRTPTIPHEEELFYLSDKIWGKDDHHIMNQQLTIPSSSLDMNQQFTISSPEESDTTFVGDLGLALTTMSRNQSNPLQVALQQFKSSSTSPKSVSERCHLQERKKKKKRKIENQEKHRDSSIQSQLEMENRSAVANAKDINESATSSQMHTLPDGLTVEVMVKGKVDGKVASPGKQPWEQG